MRHGIAAGIWGAVTVVALSGAPRASAQAAEDGGVDDAAAAQDGAIVELGGMDATVVGGMDAAAVVDGMDATVVVAEGGASEAGAGGGGGAKDAGGAGDGALPEYDLLERDDGGRACSAAGPVGTSNALSLVLTLVLHTLVVRRRKRK